MKIYFDGVVFPSKNHSSIEVDIKDTRGLVIVSYSRKLPYAYSAIEVESLVAAMALSFALDIGISCAVLEGRFMGIFQSFDR